MDTRYFGRVARCHQYCEELVSKIAHKLADKAKNPILKNIAKIIGEDSRKHAIILSDIAEAYGIEKFDPQDCSRYSGAAYGLYGYLLEIESKIDSVESDEEVIDTLENLIDMIASIAMTDRTIIADGLDNRLKDYFIDLLIQIEDDEFRHLTLLRDYCRK